MPMYFHPLCFWLRDRNIPAQLPGSIPQNQVSSIAHLPKPFSFPLCRFPPRVNQTPSHSHLFHAHSLYPDILIESYFFQRSDFSGSPKQKSSCSQDPGVSGGSLLMLSPTILSPISGESPWSLEIHCL